MCIYMEEKVKFEDFPKFREPELEKLWREVAKRDIFRHLKDWKD